MAKKIIGMNLQFQQEDLKTSAFVAGIGGGVDGLTDTQADGDKIGDAIASSGELSYIGSSFVKRLDPAPAIVNGTAGVNLKYTRVQIGMDSGKTIFMSGKFPDDSAKLQLMADYIKTKTLSSGAVETFAVKTGTSEY